LDEALVESRGGTRASLPYPDESARCATNESSATPFWIVITSLGESTICTCGTNHEEAVLLTPLNRAAVRPAQHLGNGLRGIYEATGNRDSLYRAVAAYEKAVAITLEGAAELTSRLYNLGECAAFSVPKQPACRGPRDAREYYRQSIERGREAALEWRSPRHILGRLAMRRAEWVEAADAYRTGLDVLERLFSEQIQRTTRKLGLREGHPCSVNAAYAFAMTETSRRQWSHLRWDAPDS